MTPTDSLVIDGYKLAMIKLGTGDSTIVYDGSENSERLFYNVTGLETGQRYTFSVVSVNFNGVSEPSDELVAVVAAVCRHLRQPLIPGEPVQITLACCSECVRPQETDPRGGL